MSARDKLRAEWFWTDRWFASSAAFLPLEARGLYRELLTRAWSQGGKLPNDEQLLQRMAAASDEEWSRSWPLVKPFWRKAKGGLVNDTQLEVMAECRRRQKVRSDKAKKAAEARWKSKSDEQCSSTAQAMPEVCPPSLSPSLSKTPSPAPDPKREETLSSNGVLDVVAHYQNYHPRAKPGEKEKRLIRDRLKKDCYSVGDLKAAIDGNHRDPYCCGENDSNREYHALELIVRDSSHVAKYMEVPAGKPVLSERTRRGVRASESWLNRMEAADGAS